MKYSKLSLFISISILLGCASKKVASESESGQKESVKSTYKTGQVHINKGECEIFILTEGENEEKLYPVSLDNMFHANKAILQFEYAPSRAPLPEGCEDCKAVVIYNVTRVRR